MSAIELLEQVKALPPRERQKLVQAILTLEEEAGSGHSPHSWVCASLREQRQNPHARRGSSPPSAAIHSLAAEA